MFIVKKTNKRVSNFIKLFKLNYKHYFLFFPVEVFRLAPRFHFAPPFRTSSNLKNYKINSYSNKFSKQIYNKKLNKKSKKGLLKLLCCFDVCSLYNCNLTIFPY